MMMPISMVTALAAVLAYLCGIAAIRRDSAC